MQKQKNKPKSAKDILLSHDWLENRAKSEKYISQEFQDYGLRLAHMLGDTEHKSLYIKLAKTERRALLEKAASFTSDYYKAKNKGKIFMWKLKELKAESLSSAHTDKMSKENIDTQTKMKIGKFDF